MQTLIENLFTAGSIDRSNEVSRKRKANGAFACVAGIGPHAENFARYLVGSVPAAT